MNKIIKINKGAADSIIISFPYNPIFIKKIKTIKNYRWHSDKKHWSLPNLNGTLENLMKVFRGEEIHLDPALQSQLSRHIIMKSETAKQSLDNFENLRRELLSRKYSYKTVKTYIYFNRDFLNFIHKKPLEVNNNYIKEYLVYLSEKKGASTSTLNQAINALKFYYGNMLKRKFVFEVKGPRKDKKLPVVLSKEEVAKILDSVYNLKHKAILMLVYSAGLRVGEVVRLKPEDIDSNRMLIHIKGSKGRKDRYTMLSESVLKILR